MWVCNGANDYKKGVSEVLGNCACFTALLYLYTSHSGFRKLFNNWTWSILLSAIYRLFSTVLDANVHSYVCLFAFSPYMLTKVLKTLASILRTTKLIPKCFFVVVVVVVFVLFCFFPFLFVFFCCCFLVCLFVCFFFILFLFIYLFIYLYIFIYIYLFIFARGDCKKLINPSFLYSIE